MFENPVKALHYTRHFYISDHMHHSTFVNTAWLSYASMCEDFEIICDEVLKNEYGDYQASYVIRISIQNAKKLLEGFDAFVDE